jgi:hypothetical protein
MLVTGQQYPFQKVRDPRSNIRAATAGCRDQLAGIPSIGLMALFEKLAATRSYEPLLPRT